ncbi:MAG: efflux RND transporter periplasmic adaptor subunit [Methyloversatilis sp.]|jgi:cobalt-zinc-cadmium efflux system membrane fusion protein|uniref:efflux RND transporter periplasmic adaptor subunit n=1 Tax=Methyloversatilis TaxID=378210 RepID=UPI0003763C43|nr:MULTISPECIES: efflux RND transporter periplasmic adaptor subunit [Methyloversatilis]MCR6668243.1 efflux RND transporter periplasmic adaptor subunit [Methyloversatilis sp.]
MKLIQRPLLCAGLLGVSLLLGACSEESDTAAPTAAAAPVDPNLVQAGDNLGNIIKLGTVSRMELSDTLRVAGQVDFDEQRVTRIGATVTGRVTELTAMLGQQVKVGDTLAVLNSTELGAAQLAYMKARAQAQLNERNVERAQQLFAADVIGSAELQRRESELSISRAEMRAAADQLRVLGVSSKSLEKLTSTGAINSVSPVVATMAGTVVERLVAQGQVVQPSEVMFTVADLSRVWVEAEVPEQQAAAVQPGQTIQVEIPALGQQLTAKLIFIADTVNPMTRTIMVRSELDNSDRSLKPAMLATVLIQGRPTARLVVPDTAIVRENNKDYLFVEVGPQQFKLTEVALGPAIGTMRPVLGGVAEGTKVVTEGAFHLNNERKRKELE